MALSASKEITLKIDGQDVDYIRKDSISAPQKNGPLSLVVLHRGWIFVGRFDGETITDCHNVRYFSKVGFGGLSQGAKHAKAQLDKCRDVRVDPAALMFTVPLAEDWHNA